MSRSRRREAYAFGEHDGYVVTQIDPCNDCGFPFSKNFSIESIFVRIFVRVIRVLLPRRARTYCQHEPPTPRRRGR